MSFFSALGFGLLEYGFFSVVFLLLVLGCSFSGEGSRDEGFKWWVLSIATVIVGVYYWKDWTFASVGSSLMSFTFWKPVLAYLILGLLYSIVEFIMEVRRSATVFSSAWASFLKNEKWITVLDGKQVKYTFEQIIQMAKAGEQKVADEAHELVQHFARHNSASSIISPVIVQGNALQIEPKLNRLALASYISSWTVLWPAYLVSLICGDLLSQIFKLAADLFINFGNKFVKFHFRDVFKV